MEQAYPNIAMQRIVDEHTKYMVRSRPKCKMDRETSGHWSTSKLGRLYELLYEYPNMGITRDRHGCHHLPPTPQPWSTITSEGFREPEHHTHV